MLIELFSLDVTAKATDTILATRPPCIQCTAVKIADAVPIAKLIQFN